MHMAEVVLKGFLSGTSGAGLEEQASVLLQPPSALLQQNFQIIFSLDVFLFSWYPGFAAG